MSFKHIKVTPISPAIGAELTGVDLSSVCDETAKEIHQALLDHNFLSFPDQDVSPQALMNLGEHFGTLNIHPFIPHLEKHQIVPPTGGDTLFCNVYKAYVGATHLSKLCQQLEDMGKGGVLEGAPALYQEVQQEFHRVQIALKEYYPDETAEETRQTEDILDPAPLADLKSLEGLGDFSLQNTIDLFFEDVPKRLEAAQSAMENSDTETWSREAHTIKSSARDLGGKHLAETCQELETLGKEGISEGAVDLLEQVREEFQTFRSVLEDYLKSES